MRKDLFTSQIGFSQIYGTPTWVKPRLATGWGIDDMSLYDSALLKIKELNQQKEKWFMTLLTVSTHHPYNVPNVSSTVSFDQALSYADNSVKVFIDALKKNKTLENTLVIIASDEANGTGDIGFGQGNGGNSNFISDNHGPFVAVGRRILPRTKQSQVFSQVDVPATILDYLAVEKNKPIGGRSLFRRYSEPKKVFFGNVYRDIFGYFQGAEEMVLCNASIICSLVLLDEDSFSSDFFKFIFIKFVTIFIS